MYIEEGVPSSDDTGVRNSAITSLSEDALSGTVENSYDENSEGDDGDGWMRDDNPQTDNSDERLDAEQDDITFKDEDIMEEGKLKKLEWHIQNVINKGQNSLWGWGW